jgi:N,N-dimethylformamidase
MGYTDRLSAAPDDRVALMVSSTATRWRAELQRLHALEIPAFGVERRVASVPAVAPVECEGREQVTAIGSYACVDAMPAPDPEAGLTVQAVLMPTRPGAGLQVALAHRAGRAGAGWALGLDGDGRAALWVATTAGVVPLTGDSPLVAGCWYRATAVIDPSAGEARLDIEPVGTFAANRVVADRGAPQRVRVRCSSLVLADEGVPLLIGCGGLDDDGRPHDGYDGRVERPLVVGAASGPTTALAEHPALVGLWDPAAGIGPHGIAQPSVLHDVGPAGRHGRCVNHPARAVTGHCWTGDVIDFRHAPDHYAALHFHRTDLTDCRWPSQAQLTLPADLPSGVYAVHLSDADGAEDLVPLIVRPPAGRTTAKALLVLSTNSYLAYGNDHVGVDSPRTQVWHQMVPTLGAWERFRDTHRELGLSLYEVHSDGTGVMHSSWRRPLLTLRPTVYDGNGPVWQFTGDMQIVDWLDRTGRAVDVVSDRDVHDGGAELLAGYACVMTGTHPEYPTEEMLDAYEGYVSGGGRLMYMGGNGMYWVTGYDPEDEQVIEIRRWGGTQAWCAAPGEYHLSFTGQQGGLWRFRGRAPQKTFGVGFVAAGGPSASSGYLRVAQPGSSAAWALAGVGDQEFGRFGTMGGAAGIEMDAVDATLGTPPGTVVLATSAGHTDDMLEARENFNMTSRILGGARNPRVHSDIVLVPRERGGAVFSTGSIAFASSLCHDDAVNDVSTLLGNVFDRFVSGAPVLD